MKIKIQLLAWETKAELQQCVQHLLTLADLFHAPCEKMARFPEGNIFLVQLPEEDVPLCLTMNAFVAWTGMHGHTAEMMPEFYGTDFE